MKKAWFWCCHQVPISVIGSLPVTKKSAKFVAGNKIYDIFQRYYVLWNGFFFVAAKKFVAGIQFCRSATSFGSDNFFFMKRPPGLVVTRTSCYSCVFSKTRKQQELSVMSYEKYFKPTLHAKFGDSNKKNVWPKQIFTSPSKCFTFRNFTLRLKYQGTTGNHCLKCNCFWSTGISSKTPPWGKLVQSRRFKSWSHNNSFPFEPCSMLPLKNMLLMCSFASSKQIGEQ